MGLFTKKKGPSAPGLRSPKEGLAPAFPEECVGCEIVHEGESPLKAEYV